MDSGITVVTNPTVNVRLTSTISSFEVQRRFNRGISIAELKVSLSFLFVIHSTPLNMLALPLGFPRHSLHNTLHVVKIILLDFTIFILL